jgi:formylglycine-generating enzyme required for sulfatase activity/serine/threonine protein kinase
MHDSPHRPDHPTPRLSSPPAELDGAPLDLFAEVIARLSGRRESFTRYRVQGEVARGGMGKILRVRDEDLHRDLAMKVILQRSDAYSSSGSIGIEPRMLTRFLEEAQVTGQLDHPGIVPVHEMGLDAEGCVYFTMRLVAGRDLEKIFALVAEEKEGWTRTRAVGAILKVCEAVAYAHDKGVIHRDLKPANIMVGRFGEVYVMDWGLARVMGRPERRDVRLRAKEAASTAVHSNLMSARMVGTDSALVTMDGDVVGTPAYMSPEQARGEIHAIGPLTDVYAVGAILYHLLAGHPPYVPPGGTTDPIEIWRRVREGPPEPVRKRAPTAHPELAAICAKAMARSMEERYPTMFALAEDVQAYLEGRVVGAYEAGAWAEFRKWVQRNKALAWTILAAAFFIVAGSATAAIVLSNKNAELVAANDKSRVSEQRAIENAELASANATRAQQNAAIAEERAAKILRLSDAKRLSELENAAARLWPALPANVAKYESWIADARALAARLPEHESTLNELTRQAAASDAAGERPSAVSIDRAEERWQHDNQLELVVHLRTFADPEKGRIRDVEHRLEFARTIEERSVTGADAKKRWSEALASMADRAACPKYEGLMIRPQIGLLPIGRDSRSGLWEFVHLQSGTPPARDEHNGNLHMSEESGIVLVLLPGGSFRMGAQSTNAAGENFDPRAESRESPVNTVTLAPFFMSKYEMTQGQWLRFTGRNPSVYNPTNLVGGNLAHPVEQVSWTECNEVLDQLGLALPTEAQWEYAARSGTSTPWWTGADKESLEGAANLADQSAARAGVNWPGIADWPELDDGFAASAPVGSFHASPFGLHDTSGNVWEWCRDLLGGYDAPVKDGDGERSPIDKRYRISRGGSFYHSAAFARSAYRNNSAPETRANHLGVRPARVLEK